MKSVSLFNVFCFIKNDFAAGFHDVFGGKVSCGAPACSPQAAPERAAAKISSLLIFRIIGYR